MNSVTLTGKVNVGQQPRKRGKKNIGEGKKKKEDTFFPISSTSLLLLSLLFLSESEKVERPIFRGMENLIK